ncbi:unnamed protein product [Rotaria sp. Silwood1]|nr:unnamed protein product [Rotaria sp. Silwood1]
MSLSKLESLPNELLIDIIEKYINGVDLLRAFSFQLNQHFDALITQCQRLRFDFIQCKKDDFRVCMGLLPAYIDKIEELAISEQDTPGQVYAFLSFFPSFGLFKQLRTLYFHFNHEDIDWKMVERALYSLSQTTITTLSIKAMKTDDRSLLGNVIVDLFRLKSLKRFSFMSKMHFMNWSDVATISSNIEHLTISGLHFRFDDLQYIYKCAPRLKYLDVDLINNIYPYYDDIEKNIIPMSTLRTLVLYFEQNSPITMDMLRKYFNCMPVLKRLEIKAYSEILDANAWQTLLETSLPLLTHFTLRTTTFRVEEDELQNVLAAFQNSYWLAKKNFNILITKHEHSDFNGFGIDKMKHNARYEFDWPVVQCWIAPNRTSNNELMIINENIIYFHGIMDLRTMCFIHNYDLVHIKVYFCQKLYK